MGRRKNQPTSKFGPWGKIIVIPDNNDTPQLEFPLDEKGNLKNRFKSKKHDRTLHHMKYIPETALSRDARFISSHLAPQQQFSNEEEETNIIQPNISLITREQVTTSEDSTDFSDASFYNSDSDNQFISFFEDPFINPFSDDFDQFSLL